MKDIAILLPYKENFTENNAGAASIWVKDYLNRIIEIFDKKSQSIKFTLSKYTDINVKQITKIDCSILYLAILEFLYLEDIPKKVIINESILLAKKFSSEDSFKFINKILDKISKKVRNDEK